MINGMLKVFAGTAISVFALIIIIYCSLLSASTTTQTGEETIDWNYAIVIDAGSTGSRLFLFIYRALSEKHLIDVRPVINEKTLTPVVMKISPGLSSFSEKPHLAAYYIRPLLDYAIKFIPEEKHRFTSLFILATAGMRLLSIEMQDAILSDLRTTLPLITNVQIIPEHIRVIEGKWEGIYSWIAVNYILGRFNHSKITGLRESTVGIVDMGGASVQIAMELNSTEESMGDTVENINLGCKDDDNTYNYWLYVTTFLGYGVNEGLRKYEQRLSDIISSNNIANRSYARDPCLPLNLVKMVNRKDGSNFARKGYGDWETCVADLAVLLTKTVENSDCYALKCFLGMVRAPSVPLSDVELYGFSEYWFSLEDVLNLGGSYNFSRVAEKAKDFCKLKWSTIQKQFRSNGYPKASDERLRTQCFKSAWITAVLHSGFSIDKTYNRFQSVYNINGQEVHWAVGALLYYMRYTSKNSISNTPTFPSTS